MLENEHCFLSLLDTETIINDSSINELMITILYDGKTYFIDKFFENYKDNNIKLSFMSVKDELHKEIEGQLIIDGITVFIDNINLNQLWIDCGYVGHGIFITIEKIKDE